MDLGTTLGPTLILMFCLFINRFMRFLALSQYELVMYDSSMTDDDSFPCDEPIENRQMRKRHV